MSSPLPPPRKKRNQRNVRSAASARSAQGTRPASEPELAGSSTLNPLALEEEAKLSSRSARRAKLLEKVREPGAQPSVHAGGDVELVMMGPVMGRSSEGNSRPVVEPVLPMEKHSMRNRLSGILVVLTAIIVCVASIVTVGSTERATELGYMNCVRLWTAPSVACFSFSAFFIVAAMFQAAQSATASVTHRGIFSKVALLFVCIVAIAAASIGYPSPQGVCSNCTCGVCKVFRSEEQVLGERNGTCAEKERSIAVMSNAATGSEPNTSSVSQLKCPAGDDTGVHPPELCSPLK